MDPVLIAELQALVADAVKGDKPKTTADALVIYHDLTTRLGIWLVSELPAAERKMALLALWAAQQVETVVCGC